MIAHLTAARDLLSTATEYVHAVLARVPSHRLAELEGVMVRQISQARTARGAGVGAQQKATARVLREALAAGGLEALVDDALLSREDVIANLDRCLRYDVVAEARLVAHDEAQRALIARLEAQLANLQPEAS